MKCRGRAEVETKGSRNDLPRVMHNFLVTRADFGDVDSQRRSNYSGFVRLRYVSDVRFSSYRYQRYTLRAFSNVAR